MKSFYPDLNFIPGSPGSFFYNHPDRNTKRAAATTATTTTINPLSGSNVKTVSCTPGDDKSKLVATTILQKYPKFLAHSTKSLAGLAKMQDCYQKQDNRLSDSALVPRNLNPTRDKDDKLLLYNSPKLLSYQQQYDTTIPAATGTTTAAPAAITNSTTPITAAAGNSLNTTAMKGDDSGSMLLDKNVEEAEIKKKAAIFTVLQSNKLSSSAQKLPSDKCLRDKYLESISERNKVVQNQEDTLSKK